MMFSQRTSLLQIKIPQVITHLNDHETEKLHLCDFTKCEQSMDNQNVIPGQKRVNGMDGL